MLEALHYISQSIYTPVQLKCNTLQMHLVETYQKLCTNLLCIFIFYDKATFLHNNFNSNDSANIRRNVSLKITLIAFFGVYKQSQNFCTNVLCWSVDQLIFRQRRNT